MSNSMTLALVGVSMIGVALILVIAIRAYMAAASKRRMTSMLERVGIDPVLAATGDNAQIVREIRQRCHTCATEAVVTGLGAAALSYLVGTAIQRYRAKTA